MRLVDALHRTSRLPEVERMIVFRVLVDVINLYRIAMASPHGIDNPMRRVDFAIDVNKVKNIAITLVDGSPSCHPVLGALVPVDCIAKP